MRYSLGTGTLGSVCAASPHTRPSTELQNKVLCYLPVLLPIGSGVVLLFVASGWGRGDRGSQMPG